ncbi:bacillithiol biosynthesis cysteine-adding enzyme BshC [bacterium]|nr:bacillithiol biosynthesis cysteine-adding enzyme BshC [bacterium]
MTPPSPSFPIQWQERLRNADPEVLAWYAAGPQDLAEHARRRIDRMPDPLTDNELQEWLDWLAPFDPPESVLSNLRKLTEAGTLAVVTGQQAGLFGGPMMVLFKAIAAVKLAREIETATGRPTVPIFWVASDDHDFAEIAVHEWAAADGSLRTWRVEEDPAQAGFPVYARTLPKEQLRAFLEEFLESTPETDFRPDIEAFIRTQIEDPTATWESQFVATILKYLGTTGLVPVAPRLGWLRRRAAPVMKREIEMATDSSRLLLEAGERLQGLGAEGATIHRRGNEASFFLDWKGVRAKVVWDADTAKVLHPVGGEELAQLTRDELLGRLDSTPEDFSPNAALRPVVQDVALPTVAYVGGPAEVLYHAQIGALYEHFDAFRPALVPRPSGVLIEGRLNRLAKKLDLSIAEALQGGSTEVHEAAVRQADPEGLRGRVDEQVREVQRALEQLGTLVESETKDTGLRQAVDKIAGGVEKGTEKFIGRLDDFLIRRDQERVQQADRLIEALWPNGAPQERVVGMLSPLVRNYGPDAPIAIGEALDPHAQGMQMLDVSAIMGK